MQSCDSVVAVTLGSVHNDAKVRKECRVVCNERVFHLSTRAFYSIAMFRVAVEDSSLQELESDPDHKEDVVDNNSGGCALSWPASWREHQESEHQESDHQERELVVLPGRQEHVVSIDLGVLVDSGSCTEAELELALSMAASAAQCTQEQAAEREERLQGKAVFKIPLPWFKGVIAALSYMQAVDVMNACLAGLLKDPVIWETTTDCDSRVHSLLGPFVLDALCVEEEGHDPLLLRQSLSDAMFCALLRGAVQRATMPGGGTLKALGRRAESRAASVSTRSPVSALLTRKVSEELVMDVLPLIPPGEVEGRLEHEKTPLMLAAGNNFACVAFMLLGCNAGVARDRAAALKRAVAPLAALRRPPIGANEEFLKELRAVVTSQVRECLRESEAQLTNVGMMLDRVHDVDDRGTTSLIFAARRGCLVTAALLLAAGVDANAASVDGSTALKAAAGYGHYHVTALLLGAGACVDQESPLHANRQTALMHAHDSAVAELLLAFGAEVDKMTRWTALMTASMSGKRDVIGTLLRFGADICRVNSADEDALICATLYYGFGVVPLLIKAGSNVQRADWRGHTALMYAARNADACTVQALLDAGADVNARSVRGKTVVMFAAENRGYNSEVARALRRVIERSAATTRREWYSDECWLSM